MHDNPATFTAMIANYGRSSSSSTDGTAGLVLRQPWARALANAAVLGGDARAH